MALIRKWYVNTVVQRNLVGQFVRKSRRFVLSTFKPQYIQKSIEHRTGECRRCGSCCKFIFRCPFLIENEQKLPSCRMYGHFRPSNCRVYPFDQFDTEVDQCGYQFTAPEEARE